MTCLVQLRVGAFMPILATGLEQDLRGTGGPLEARRAAVLARIGDLVAGTRPRSGVGAVDIGGWG